jgi:D-beta-D-heptose 7-phosphate kinase/D-beta-D-heptose 1-phosphate adenosyltransferase
MQQDYISAEPGCKIVSRERLLEIRGFLSQRRQRVIFTNGCFDLLHRGHVEYLRQARSLGDFLIVGLNSDDSARALKGPGHPIQPQADRAALLAEMQCVSVVCIFNEPSVENLVQLLLPDVLVKGGDYSLKDVVGRQAVEAAGGLVTTLALWEGASTSELTRKIKNTPG